MEGRGESDSGISSGPVMAQCRVMEAGQRVRAGFPPGTKMSEVTWGRLVGEKRREEGVRGRKEERKTLWGYNSGELLPENFPGSSREKREEALQC